MTEEPVLQMRKLRLRPGPTITLIPQLVCKGGRMRTQVGLSPDSETLHEGGGLGRNRVALPLLDL